MKYLTRKTNIRTRVELIDRIKNRTHNYNRFCADALSEFMRRYSFGYLTDSEKLFIAGINNDLFGTTAWKAETRLITYRLKTIDLDLVQMSSLTLSRVFNAALLAKLNND